MEKTERISKLIERKYTPSDPSDITFLEDSPIYIGTNENHRGVLSVIDVYNQNVLCSCGGGDFALNALANDALNVTVFDIDVLAKDMLDLKIAAIKTFPNCDDFKAFFTFGDYFFSPKLFEKIKRQLNSESCQTWEFIYEKTQKIYGTDQPIYQSSLLRHELQQTLAIQSQYNLYYDEYAYKNLRRRLQTEYIGFADLSISNICKIANKETYNVLYLSNILQYYQNIVGLNEQEKVHRFIENNLKKIVKPSGTIGVCYGYYGYEFNEISDIRVFLLNEYPNLYEEKKFASIIPPTEQASLILTRK